MDHDFKGVSTRPSLQEKHILEAAEAINSLKSFLFQIKVVQHLDHALKRRDLTDIAVNSDCADPMFFKDSESDWANEPARVDVVVGIGMRDGESMIPHPFDLG
jgi:hypothetical protein